MNEGTSGAATKHERDPLTARIIGCALEVHRTLGPGLLEAVYEKALCLELQRAGLAFMREKPVPVNYKDVVLGELRLDLLVEDTVVVEIKAVERPEPLFEAQLLTYMRLTGKKVGPLINFNSRLLTQGIKRFVL